MLDISATIIVFVLSFQVLPVALGIDRHKSIVQTIWFTLLLIVGQVLLFYVGYLLGQRFMHLMEEFKGTVIFVGFFLIGIRMIVEAFKVRKGERTFTFDSTLPVLLASLAVGINTFLAGLLFTFLPFEISWLIMILTFTTLIMAGIGTLMNPEKTAFSLSSFLFLAGGIWMIFSSIYIGFFV